MRQSIAIAIFFVAIKYIIEKNIKKYFICCLLALFFHNSALILFPLYFINRINLTKKKLIILNAIFIPTIIIGVLQVPILKPLSYITSTLNLPISGEKINNLLNIDSEDGINIFHTFEYFLLMIMIYLKFNKIKEIDKSSELILKLFLILLPIFTLFRGYELLTRQKDYFTLTYAIILGYLCLIDNKKYSILIQICTVAICLYGFIRFIMMFDNGAMMPYNSYLLKGINIFQ
jgi:hypothetical protein